MADWTIRALMEWTEKHFQQKGIESPRLETQVLLAHALKCKKPDLYTRWNEVVAEEKRGRFRELLLEPLRGVLRRRRADREVLGDVGLGDGVGRIGAQPLVAVAEGQLDELAVAHRLDGQPPFHEGDRAAPRILGAGLLLRRAGEQAQNPWPGSPHARCR